MAYYLSPIGNTQTLDANGDPLVGGTISTFLAGTSTAETTYTDDTGGTSQGVVMTLNSLGYPENGPVWMLGGVPLKFIIKNAAGVTQSTFDDISGIGDTATASDQWTLYGAAPTYISATSFSVVGDQTNTFEEKRRTKTVNSGGTIYSTISASSFATGVTTVTVVNDSGVLDSGLSAVSYSMLTATNDAVPRIVNLAALRVDVASVAGTVNLSTAAPSTDDIRITGTEAITAFTVLSGRVIRVVAGGAFTLTNNASIVTNSSGNIVCASGDSFVLRATASNVVEVLQFTRAASVNLLTTQVFTSSGTYTKPAGVRLIRVRVVGGGGAGGVSGAANQASGGGGGGGYSEELISAVAITTETVTIGAGGVSGGAAAGTTSFGSYLQATGGDAGAGGSGTAGASAGGLGGTGSGGTINCVGGSGSNNIGALVGGVGGCSAMGGGARHSANAAAVNGGAYGGGGSGVGNNSVTAGGGTGAAGVVIVEEFY